MGGAIGRRLAHLSQLLAALALVALTGCNTLPVITPDMARVDPESVQFKTASGRILSTEQTGEGVVSKDVFERGRDLVRTLSQDDFPGTGIKVALDGTIGR